MDIEQEPARRGRKRIYTEEEAKQRRYDYNKRYQKARYSDDKYYRDQVVAKQHKYLEKIDK